ncbi:MAG TPA: twin-arginine translocase TatA/TatE family subunit [Phycicoccus sp.]|jgi:sec-independent protein translocase protein TatB|nr:twin-arginine translocase TatA/TatE family subunit [Phycicoccus sp.]HQK30034.1 twin-arginine translocase TatA/TatE family subunit [Phycicoccus sp.]HRA45186.1 twin-arginine translocase TatA/TatE family subunit [Phycicoccus sp.]
MFGINGWEALILVVLAVVILGPERLPEYAAKLAHGVRRLRVMAEGAKVQLKDQLGPEYQDINWRQYDPRQYDPRRIVREALQEPLDYVAEPFREVRDEVKGITDEVKAIRDGSPAVGTDAAAAVMGAATSAGAAVAGTALAASPATAMVGATGSYWDREAT